MKIYIYSPQLDYFAALRDSMISAGYVVVAFDDKQALASEMKKVSPDALFFDLRYEKSIPRVLEIIYYDYTDVITIGCAEMYIEMYEDVTDQIFLPDSSIDSVIESIQDNVSGRQLLKSCGFVGRSVELAGVARMIDQVAPTDITVLVTGPSGAGKEMVARAIHDKSDKDQESFFSLNISSLAPGVLESELFGHEKGSFTGAAGQRNGYFEMASKGTLFLDEIGELPADLQVKLLRVLEEKSFYRVGGNKKIHTGARLIFATNRNLADEVERGNFRQDLFYRLNVVNITVPALAARPKDIVPLAKEFIRQSRYGNHTRANPIEHGALKLFMKYHWPGNVRELRNVVESLLILSQKGVITQQDFEKYLREKSLHDNKLPVPTGRTPENAEHQLILQALLSLKEEIVSLRMMIADRMFDTTVEPGVEETPDDTLNISEHEKSLISKTLEQVNGNRKKAAELLGIGERTLYRKISRYGLK